MKAIKPRPGPFLSGVMSIEEIKLCLAKDLANPATHLCLVCGDPGQRYSGCGYSLSHVLVSRIDLAYIKVRFLVPPRLHRKRFLRIIHRIFLRF